jgi:hypothetical protein
MNSGVKNPKGLCINFPYSYEVCLFLKKLLFNKYELETIIESTPKNIIIIKKECLIKLESIIGPFIIKSKKYLLQTSFAKDLTYSRNIPNSLNP